MFGHSAITPFLGGTLGLYIVPSTSTSHSLHLHPTLDIYIQISTSSSTSYSRHQHLTLYISILPSTSSSTSHSQPRRLTLEPQFDYLVIDPYISLSTSSSTSYSRHQHLTLDIYISLSKLTWLSSRLHLYISSRYQHHTLGIFILLSTSTSHSQHLHLHHTLDIYISPSSFSSHSRNSIDYLFVCTSFFCTSTCHSQHLHQHHTLDINISPSTSTSHSQHLHQHHTLDIYISLLTFSSHSRNSIDYLFVYTSFFCTSTSFFDGYCSTVQCFLDWFEVDSGFTELPFIQIDLNVVCVFVLYSRVSLSSCPFWTFCTASPARWECL